MAAIARKLHIVPKHSIGRYKGKGHNQEDQNSGNHAIRKMADILLRDHPEGIKISTLRNVCETRMGKTLFTPYILSAFEGFDYFIDCKNRIIFKT